MRGVKAVITARVSNIYSITTFSGRHPFVVQCQWYDAKSGKVLTFRSEALGFNPELSGHLKVGSKIEVLLDPSNPYRRNYVIVDPLKKMSA